LSETILCDRTYATEEMASLMRAAGFLAVKTHPGWAGLALYDAAEWVVYIGEK
jgi:hypothetical protein